VTVIKAIARVVRRGGAPLLGAALLALADPASALQIAEGDFVGVFVKDGTEVIVNLGSPQVGEMPPLPANLFSGPPFNGSLVDVKFVGLAVPDLDRTVNCCGGTFPQPAIIYTSPMTDPTPSDDQIELAANAVDQAGAGANTWFNFLRALGGTDSEVINSSELFSYTTVLGLGTDAVANSFTFSTAGVVEADGTLRLGVYEAVRGYEFAGGPATEYTAISTLVLDGTDVTFEEAPEAAQVLGTLVGIAVLWGGSRVRRSRRLG
jgi:hypothetical protein